MFHGLMMPILYHIHIIFNGEYLCFSDELPIFIFWQPASGAHFLTGCD